MNNFSAFEHSSALSSIDKLVRSDAFTLAIKHQELVTKALRPALGFWEQQERFNRSLLSAAEPLRKQHELVAKNLTRDMVQAIYAYPSIAEALESSAHAAAMLHQPFIGVSVPFAAQEKSFSQISRISKITALQETWKQINNLIPAVQEAIPKAAMTLTALEYIEKNHPNICHNVDKVLSSSVDKQQSADSLDGYIALCEEISTNLAILYSTVDSSEISKGIACLAIIFADMLIYLRYCKSLKEKEKA